MKKESKTNKPQRPNQGPREGDELVVVYRSMGPLRAQVIKGKLESAGIPAVLRYESAGAVMGIIVDGMGQVEVLVSKSREQEARQLITV